MSAANTGVDELSEPYPSCSPLVHHSRTVTGTPHARQCGTLGSSKSRSFLRCQMGQLFQEKYAGLWW